MKIMIELSGFLSYTRLDIARKTVNKSALTKLAKNENWHVRYAVAKK